MIDLPIMTSGRMYPGGSFVKIYDIPVTSITGENTTLAPYRGQVLLIVNVASKCGFTPQYAQLEALYRKYRDQGFAVLGFPCNQFGFQEPGNEQQIQEFCKLTYEVDFPMFAKVKVNGSNAHPLYQELKSAKPGMLGTGMIKWNFTKFLVNRQGEVIARYGPMASPSQIEEAIQAALAAPAATPTA